MICRINIRAEGVRVFYHQKITMKELVGIFDEISRPLMFKGWITLPTD